MRNILSTNHANITIHTWSTLDTKDVGWLLHMHPHFHNRQDIHQKLSKTLTETTSAKEIPEFKLYIKSVTDGIVDTSLRSTAQAFIIKSTSANVHSLRELLHTAYNSQSPTLPGKFIPANYQHIENKEKYSSLICLQQQYLNDHRNIHITGITHDDVKKNIHFNNTSDTIINHVLSSKHISWISPSVSPSTNEWNISTVSSLYPESCQLVKTITNEIKNSSSAISLTTNPIQSTQTLTTATKTYLHALNEVIPPSIKSHQNTNTRSPSTTTNTSSLTNSFTRTQKDIQFENLKEHIARTISNLNKEVM